MQRTALLAVLILGALGAMPARPAVRTTETRSYIGTAAGIVSYTSCNGGGIEGSGLGPDGQGGVCFLVPDGASTLDMVTTDDVFANSVLALVVFLDSAGNEIGHDGYCDGLAAEQIPTGTRFVVAGFPQPTLGFYPACPLFGTRGTITATFS